MKTRAFIPGYTAILAICAINTLAQSAGPGVPDRLMVTVDTQQTSAAVSKYEYGQFIEHIGSAMYGVGDIDKRTSDWDYAWNAMQPRDRVREDRLSADDCRRTLPRNHIAAVNRMNAYQRNRGVQQ